MNEDERNAEAAVTARIEADRMTALQWTIDDARWEYNLQFHRGANLGLTVDQLVSEIFADRLRRALRFDQDIDR